MAAARCSRKWKLVRSDTTVLGDDVTVRSSDCSLLILAPTSPSSSSSSSASLHHETKEATFSSVQFKDLRRKHVFQPTVRSGCRVAAV